MAKFYFTYGTEGQPFFGGWTEVEADDEEMARQAYLIFHPLTPAGFIPCSTVYPEERFMKTSMYLNSNFGYRCHERISLKRHINESAKSERSTNHD